MCNVIIGHKWISQCFRVHISNVNIFCQFISVRLNDRALSMCRWCHIHYIRHSCRTGTRDTRDHIKYLYDGWKCRYDFMSNENNLPFGRIVSSCDRCSLMRHGKDCVLKVVSIVAEFYFDHKMQLIFSTWMAKEWKSAKEWKLANNIDVTYDERLSFMLLLHLNTEHQLPDAI